MVLKKINWIAAKKEKLWEVKIASTHLGLPHIFAKNVAIFCTCCVASPPRLVLTNAFPKKEARKHPLIGRKWEKRKKRTCNFFARHFISQIAGCIPKCVSRNKKECQKCKPHIPAPPYFLATKKKKKSLPTVRFPTKRGGEINKLERRKKYWISRTWNKGKGGVSHGTAVFLFLGGVDFGGPLVAYAKHPPHNCFEFFLPSLPTNRIKKEHIIPPPPWASIQTPLRWC